MVHLYQRRLPSLIHHSLLLPSILGMARSLLVIPSRELLGSFHILLAFGPQRFAHILPSQVALCSLHNLCTGAIFAPAYLLYLPLRDRRAMDYNSTFWIARRSETLERRYLLSERCLREQERVREIQKQYKAITQQKAQYSQRS